MGIISNGRALSSDLTSQAQALFENTARNIARAGVRIKKKHIVNGMQADPGYGAGI